LDTIVVRGEIRVSGIYDGSANRPKRWRVVDPKSGRTLAYIEVPKGSPIDPVQYYGKYIGVRASGCRLLRGTIPPAWIYTVEEISVLDPAAQSKEPAGQPAGKALRRVAMKASPAPTAVPATQPAAAPGTAPAD